MCIVYDHADAWQYGCDELKQHFLFLFILLGFGYGAHKNKETHS